MKKNLLLFIFLTLLVVGIFLPRYAKADPQPMLSLSDAVLADLALRNDLDYISIDFKDKKSPNTITINETRQWLPASTIKLFVAMYAAQQINKKNISLDQWVTIDDKNVVPTELETNDYPVLTAGLTTTVDILLKKMITQSDNTAYNTLLDLLDRQEVTQYVQSLGLQHTIVGSKLNLDDEQTQYEYTTPGFNINTTTAADYEKAYELIDGNKVPGSSLLFAILKQQKIQDMIPALLPIKDLTIANKTGDLDPLYHDGGIIIGDNRHYILTIFTNLGNPNILAHISQLIFTKNYNLVGADIPDKYTTQQPQALDPLVVNSEGFKKVLGATTQVINVPIPQITAADLGISQNDLALVIPNNILVAHAISPTSPFHQLVPIFYAVSKLVALGPRARQDVDLTLVNQQVADAAYLSSHGKLPAAVQLLSTASQNLQIIAENPSTKSDAQIQIAVKSLSDTSFHILQKGIGQKGQENSITTLIPQIAQQAKVALETNRYIPQARIASATSQKPLLGTVIASNANSITVRTVGQQIVTVPLQPVTKITSQQNLGVINSSVTPSITGETTPSQSVQQPTPPPAQPELPVGSTIAVMGVANGVTFQPSLIMKVQKEVVAPQPVVVVKVNSVNKTMVVSDNGNPVQVDLTNKTTIKGTDTNLPLTAIKPGSVIVVHGTQIQPVRSDTPSTVSPSPITITPKITGNSQQSSTAPTNVVPSITSTSKSSKAPTPIGQATGVPNITSVVPAQPTVAKGKPTDKPETTHSSVIPPKAPTTTQSPTIIQATSVQVVQQKPTTATPAPQKPSQPSPVKPAQSQPQPPAQKPPAVPATNNSSSQENKNKSK